MEVTLPLLLRLFYWVKWPITPNKSAGSIDHYDFFHKVFILGLYKFLAYLECVKSYAWSKDHSDPDLSSVPGCQNGECSGAAPAQSVQYSSAVWHVLAAAQCSLIPGPLHVALRTLLKCCAPPRY